MRPAIRLFPVPRRQFETRAARERPANFLIATIMIRLCIILVLLSHGSLPTVSYPVDGSRSISFTRSVAKAAARFDDFGKHVNATLVVDGNNVRGIGQFESDFIEVQDRVSSFCLKFGITRAVVVWDHGSCKFAAHENRSSDLVDMVILFSGLNQRADDVIVKEAQHLASAFCNDDWSSLCFVTNDRALQQKLCHRIAQYASVGSSSEDRSLLMDSTRFSALLPKQDKACPRTEQDQMFDKIRQIRTSLHDFARLQRVGYHPRREKTWQRCILGESLRRVYCEQKFGESSEFFSHRYILALQNRGFANSSTGHNNSMQEMWTVPGPARLDKRQQRILARYNRARLAS